MEFLLFTGLILTVLFFIGLFGLISGKGNKKVFFNPFINSNSNCDYRIWYMRSNLK